METHVVIFILKVHYSTLHVLVSVKLNNNETEHVENITFLGIQLNEYLSFKNHIVYLLNRFFKYVGLFCKLKVN